LPSTEDYGRLYDLGWHFLKSYGYLAAYGGVNFSRIENETGTSAYFEGRLLDGFNYLGLGNYASSLCGQQWWFAPYSVNEWIRRVEEGLSFPVGDAYACRNLNAWPSTFSCR